jgi:hypothetical protein
MADWTTPAAIHSRCGELGGNEAVKAIDDDVGSTSYWYHGSGCYHWIIFDFGSTKTITKIQIYQGNFGGASGLYVYVGDNPADLGAAVWEGVLNAGGWNESGAFEKNGRYVKLVSKSNAGMSLYEFDALVSGGVAHYKTVSEILGLVDAKGTKTAFHKTASEVLGLVDDWDKNRCKKCKPSVTVVF